MGEKPDNLKKTTKTISAEQKSALEAAGYKVKGTAVLDKSGKTLGGINQNGQISSGSSKVTSILKSKPTPAAKAPPKPTASAPSKRSPVAKGLSTADLTKRASAAIDRATPAKSQRSGLPARPITPTPTKMPARPVSKTPPRLSSVTEAQWDSMSRAERTKKGLPTSWVDYVKAGGDSVVKKPKPVAAKAPNRADAYALQQKKK